MRADSGGTGPSAEGGQESLLGALCAAAEALILAEPFADAVPEALAHLGPALGAGLLAYDDFEPGGEGETISWRRACWTEPGAGFALGPRPPGPVPLRASGRGRVLEALLAGRVLAGTPEVCGEETRPERGGPGIPRCLLVPALAGDRLLGALLCARKAAAGEWSPGEVDALRRLGRLLGSLRLRREAESQRASSEERHRRVIEAAREYLWESDAEGRVTYVSDRVRDVLGYAPEEVVGRLVFGFMPPEQAERSAAAFRSDVAGKQPFRDREGVALHRDGRRVWIRTSGYPRLGPKGELLGYTGTTAGIDDRKRAEQTLRESEERYRSLVESQPELIMRWSPDGRLTYANEAFCRFFGYLRAEVVGRPMLASVRPAERETVARLAEELSRPPYGPAIEERASAHDGPRRISWTAHPVRDETGRVIEMQAIGRDVTDAHRAETELRRRDRILQAISEAAEALLGAEESTDATGAADPLALLLEKLGRAAEVPRLLLLRTETLGGDSFALRLERMWLRPDAAEPPPWPEDLIVTPEQEAAQFVRMARQDRILDLPLARAPEPLRALMLQRGVQSLLIVSILVDAEWWGSLVLPSLDAPRHWSRAETEALRISANLIAADVRRRRIQAALRDSEERYRTLVEGASQPILIIDRDGRYRFANRHACQQIRLRPEEIVGRTLWETHPKEIADRHFAVIRRALESGETSGATNPTLIAGERRWYSSHVQPLREVGDGREAALVILRDVTDLKRQEAQILAYQRQLQGLASELGLAEQRERRRIAVGLHDQVGQSLAMARLKLGLARQLPDDPARQAALDEAIGLIETSIQGTRSLIFDLSPPILHELGLEPALEWLAERHRAEDRLDVRFRGDGRPVTLAPEALGFLFQSVRELLVNVVKHAEATTVLLRKYRSEHRLAIEVVDDGVGYDAGEPDRAHGGFGLFSIRERLRHLGGSLEIESRRMQGTRATIYVPLPEAEPEGETGK